MTRITTLIFFILIAVNGIAQWSPLNPGGTPGEFTDVIVNNQDSSGNHLIASTYAGGLVESKNGGVTWTYLNTQGLDNYFISDLAQDSKGTLYIANGFKRPSYRNRIEVSTDCGLWKSTDLGKTATLVQGSNDSDFKHWQSLHFIEVSPINDNLLLVGTKKGLRISFDRGNSWKNPFLDIYSTGISDNSHVVDVAFSKRNILISTNFSFYLAPLNLEENGVFVIGTRTELRNAKFTISPLNTDIVYAFNSSINKVFKSVDGGNSFSEIQIPQSVLEHFKDPFNSTGFSYPDIAALPTNENHFLIMGKSIVHYDGNWTRISRIDFQAFDKSSISPERVALIPNPFKNKVLIPTSRGLYSYKNDKNLPDHISWSLSNNHVVEIGMSTVSSDFLIANYWYDAMPLENQLNPTRSIQNLGYYAYSSVEYSSRGEFFLFTDEQHNLKHFKNGFDTKFSDDQVYEDIFGFSIVEDSISDAEIMYVLKSDGLYVILNPNLQRINPTVTKLVDTYSEDWLGYRTQLEVDNSGKYAVWLKPSKSLNILYGLEHLEIDSQTVNIPLDSLELLSINTLGFVTAFRIDPETNALFVATADEKSPNEYTANTKFRLLVYPDLLNKKDNNYKILYENIRPFERINDLAINKRKSGELIVGTEYQLLLLDDYRSETLQWRSISANMGNTPISVIEQVGADHPNLDWRGKIVVGTKGRGLFIQEGTAVGFTETTAETNKLEAIKVFPNPSANGVFYIQDTENNTAFTIFDLNGKQVQAGFINGAAINLSGLENGIYFLQIDGATKLSKLIIAK